MNPRQLLDRKRRKAHKHLICGNISRQEYSLIMLGKAEIRGETLYRRSWFNKHKLSTIYDRTLTKKGNKL